MKINKHKVFSIFANGGCIAATALIFTGMVSCYNHCEKNMLAKQFTIIDGGKTYNHVHYDTNGGYLTEDNKRITFGNNITKIEE